MKRLAGLGCAVFGLATLSACGGGGEDAAAIKAPMTIAVRSDAFAQGAAIPKNYTCDGENVSPPLAWSGVPSGAKILALICEDPDAPMGTFTHWIVYNLPHSLTELKEREPPGDSISIALPDGTTSAVPQGKNDFGKLGYGGPCPPGGTHHYHFRLYGLDTLLALKPGASRRELFEVMKGHILAQGELMGTYAR
jgi:Raf kinase inhibitor-like YbhB/YbcL family protein